MHWIDQADRPFALPSDEWIHEACRARLAAHPELDIQGIEVDVQRGRVTLSGIVEDGHMKQLAQDLLDGVDGIREIDNGLAVRGNPTPGAAGQ